jgi:hemerythrin-like metal-binding protein
MKRREYTAFCSHTVPDRTKTETSGDEESSCAVAKAAGICERVAICRLIANNTYPLAAQFHHQRNFCETTKRLNLGGFGTEVAMAIDFADVMLGIEVMDREHIQLAAMFDTFEQCFHNRTPLENVEALVEDALHLTNEHFEHEEALMEQAGYPGISEHKFQHRNLRLSITTLVGDTLAHLQAHDPVTLEHLDVMRRLLHEHISGPDTVLAVYLKTVGVAETQELAEPAL